MNEFEIVIERFNCEETKQNKRAFLDEMSRTLKNLYIEILNCEELEKLKW